MQRRTVLLIPSDDCGWAEVRLALAAVAGIKVIGEAPHGIELAMLLQPDIIIAAAELEGTALLPRLQALHRAACARSTIILLASRLRPDAFAGVDGVEIAGYLLWSDLSPDTLRCCLEAVMRGEVVVVSQAVARAFVQMRQRGAQACPAPVHLTEREQAVLRHLALGRSYKEIAAEGLSQRTVERIVGKLEAKLDAPTPFVLGVQAAHLGWLCDLCHRREARPRPQRWR
jgi:DNA-binding NarL/FixJ family response regulator